MTVPAHRHSGKEPIVAIVTYRQLRALLVVAVAALLTVPVAAQPAAARTTVDRSATARTTTDRSAAAGTAAAQPTAGGTTAERTTAPATGNAVGRWTTTVSIPDRPDSVVTLAFRGGHLATITGPTGADGTPSYTGAGLWTLDGSSLAFTVVHPLPAADGTLLGIIHGTQRGQLTGDTFHTTGVSYLYRPDGTVSGPNPVTMTGLRAAQ